MFWHVGADLTEVLTNITGCGLQNFTHLLDDYAGCITKRWVLYFILNKASALLNLQQTRLISELSR